MAEGTAYGRDRPGRSAEKENHPRNGAGSGAAVSRGTRRAHCAAQGRDCTARSGDEPQARLEIGCRQLLQEVNELETWLTAPGNRPFSPHTSPNAAERFGNLLQFLNL